MSTLPSNPVILTPLGAAVVEALPCRKKVRRIRENYRKSGSLPCSAIFPTPESVNKFYREHGASLKDTLE